MASTMAKVDDNGAKRRLREVFKFFWPSEGDVGLKVSGGGTQGARSSRAVGYVVAI